jgi:hypothetical protein
MQHVGPGQSATERELERQSGANLRDDPMRQGTGYGVRPSIFESTVAEWMRARCENA